MSTHRLCFWLFKIIFNILPLFHPIFFLTIFIHAFSKCCVFSHKHHIFYILNLLMLKTWVKVSNKIRVEKKKKKRRRKKKKKWTKRSSRLVYVASTHQIQCIVLKWVLQMLLYLLYQISLWFFWTAVINLGKLGRELRWRRNRTRRPLSPRQIHGKIIWTLRKLHKTTSDL